MESFWIFALFLLGVVLTIKGGDLFVDGARWLAEVTGIPKFIIAATVVSLATTMPETLVSAMASYDGNYSMAMGNAIGSVACNTGFIFGVSLLFSPGTLDRRSFFGKGLIMFCSAAALLVVSIDGKISGWEVLVLVALVVLYVRSNLISAKLDKEEVADHVDKSRQAAVKNIAIFIVGAVMLVLGAQLLVNNGEAIARMLGVPDVIIALTLVALGTSLPELVTTITAISKKESSMSVGNIIGANTLDMTWVLIFSVVASYHQGAGYLVVEQPGIFVDLVACMILFSIALVPPLITRKFQRWQGVLLILVYAGYLVIRVF